MVKTEKGSASLWFRRGEPLFLAGEPVTHLYLIQSGLVALIIGRDGQSQEFARIPTAQLAGEEALWGVNAWSMSAVAQNEVQALPIPIADARARLSGGPPLVQLVTKSILARHFAAHQALLSLHAHEDPTPCPPERVTRLFAVIYHAARYSGTEQNGETTVVWPAFRKYCLRAFLESPVRLEQAINILTHLGNARRVMIPCETDPDAPDELGSVVFTDLPRIQAFIQLNRELAKPGSGPGGSAPDPWQLELVQLIDRWNHEGRVDHQQGHKEAA